MIKKLNNRIELIKLINNSKEIIGILMQDLYCEYSYGDLNSVDFNNNLEKIFEGIVIELFHSHPDQSSFSIDDFFIFIYLHISKTKNGLILIKDIPNFKFSMLFPNKIKSIYKGPNFEYKFNKALLDIHKLLKIGYKFNSNLLNLFFLSKNLDYNKDENNCFKLFGLKIEEIKI